jgi:hypothetical protein
MEIRMMKTKVFFGAVLVSLSVSTVAFAQQDFSKISLSDGGELIVFEDGKMAMLNEFGNVVQMNPGSIMLDAKGGKIEMNSDEVARLRNIMYWKDRAGK